ncbi:hypothetical protein G6F42_010284 [Rhizopus arrhizus]|nr:hypothetical protein G6F42_010284 [Rhizopus arrhizus]
MCTDKPKKTTKLSFYLLVILHLERCLQIAVPKVVANCWTLVPSSWYGVFEDFWLVDSETKYRQESLLSLLCEGFCVQLVGKSWNLLIKMLELGFTARDLEAYSLGSGAYNQMYFDLLVD